MIEKFDKRTAIFKTTLELISSQGLHATPMSQIAAKAKIGIGTIYNYFSSKDELINALFLYYKANLFKYLKNTVPHEGSVTDEIKAFLRAVVIYYVENPSILYFSEQCENSPIITEETKKEGFNTAAILTNLFARAKAENLIKDLPPEILFPVLSGAIISLTKLCLNKTVSINSPEFETSLTAICDIILR